MPLELEYIWNWFLELSSGRTSSGFGPNPLTFPDIAAWARLTRAYPTAAEVKTLLVLDRMWLRSYGEGQKAHQEWQAQQRRAQHGR